LLLTILAGREREIFILLAKRGDKLNAESEKVASEYFIVEFGNNWI
jgi:hypothetical protein